MTVVLEKTPAPKGIPILVTDAKRLPRLRERLSPAQRRWLEASGFEGKAHTFALIPGLNGEVEGVASGCGNGNGNGRWALSHLPAKLPAGRYVLGKGPVSLDPAEAAFGWALGGYRFARYKKRNGELATLALSRSAAVSAALDEAGAVALVRDMVNTPAEDMGPAEIAAIVRAEAKAYGATYSEVVGDELLRRNFPAIHAVGRAATRAPRLIELNWGNPRHPRLAVVGKGVCFDTGGVDIKGAEGMRLMKKDMGGAAHAIALARLVMANKLPYRLQLLVPAVENAIAGNAYRPGDIFKTRGGHTIEIGNTDAEGRVILCDALAYAVEQSPKMVIDFATLTGAARVALGPELPALFVNDDRFARRLERASLAVGDPLWRLPLWRNYRRLFDSDVADFNNSGRGGFAGAIVGALFLDYFVPDDIAWAHFDTYSWNDASRPGRPVGGEAQGLRAAFAALMGKP